MKNPFLKSRSNRPIKSRRLHGFVLVLVVPFFAVAMWAATQHLGDFRLDGGINEGVVDYNTGTVVRQAGEMHDMDSALKKRVIISEKLRVTFRAG